MSLILGNARLVLPDEDRIAQGDILIRDGLIAAMGQIDPEMAGNARRIDCQGSYVAPGIVDFGVKIGEPGERYKESFRTAGLAAARGGVTTMVTRPDTTPPIDQPEMLEFFVRRAISATPIRVRPMATLTKSREGREMAEIGLLMDAGAVAFSDCDSFIGNTRVMANCMKYCQQLDALVVGHPQDPWLSDSASATSGKFAMLSGLASVSPVAEMIGLDRDLALAQSTGCRYHADQVTTAMGLSSLMRAMDSGIDVTAGVSIHHLTLNELDVAEYRTFFKVKPPLRPETDRMAVVEALASGRIGILSSMHTPQDEESKRLPYEEAASGAVGLETLLAAALRLFHSGDIGLPALFRALSYNPAQRLGFDGGLIAQGMPADLVQFETETPYILDRFSLASKSKNTPFDCQKMQGMVLRTLVAGEIVYDRTVQDA